MVLYVAFYQDERDTIYIGTFGWSTSEVLAKLFIQSYEYIDDSVYTPNILEITCSSFEECEAYINQSFRFNHGLNISRSTEIQIMYSHDRKYSIATTTHIFDEWEMYFREEPESISFDEDPDQENILYNTVYALLDHGTIRDNGIKEELKKLILRIYEKYGTIQMIHQGNFDSVSYLVETGHLKNVKN